MDARSEIGPVSRILVVQVSRIGDTLLATPAIRALASAFPEAELTCLAHPKRAEILAGLPFVRRLGAITKHRAPWRGRIGGKRYDLAVIYGFDKAIVAYALRVARRVVAFRQGDPRIDARLFRAVEPPPHHSRHAVEHLLALTDALGIARSGMHLSYSVQETETTWAQGQIAALRAEGARPLIGLQIASFPTKSYRDWPVDNFVELCGRIRHDHPGAHFLIFGGALERDRTQALHAALGGCSTHYAGQLTLRQTAALMDQLDLYVGVDTGPTHIMGALHRPMVAMYHTLSPSRIYAPLEHPHLLVVEHPGGVSSGGKEDSMVGISVDTVYAKVRDALSGFAQRPC